MHRIVTLLLVVCGVIHLMPALGVLGSGELARLYGVLIDDVNVVLLMRHRAVLFALLGVLLIAAAWRSELRVLAYGAGLVSMLSFIVLAWMTPGHNALIHRVVIADWVAAACLITAATLDAVR